MTSMTIPDRVNLRANSVTLQTPDTGDAKRGKGNRRFRMVGYTGEAVKTPFSGQLIVDIAGMSVRGDRTPILLSHDYGRPVGFAETVDKSSGTVKLEGQIIAEFPAGRLIIDGSESEFPWQASIGFQIDGAKFLERGESRTVNGRDFKGPGVVVEKSTLIETSFTPAGADGNTTATVFSAEAAAGSGVVTLARGVPMSKNEFDAVVDGLVIRLNSAHDFDAECARVFSENPGGVCDDFDAASFGRWMLEEVRHAGHGVT